MRWWQLFGITLLRVMLGVIFVMHGYLAFAVLEPAGIAGYATRMGVPPAFANAVAWYLIFAHLVGGLLLILGLWTRWAALAQLPIMVPVVFVHHLQQGFFMKGIIVDTAAGRTVSGGYEFALLVLVTTLALILVGGGALALDGK